jgi:hypothetical protein
LWRRKCKKKKFSIGSIEANSNFYEIRKLEVDTFYVIINRLVIELSELDKRLNAYDNVCNINDFFLNPSSHNTKM